MYPLEIGLSFLEGLALIVSPCILPVLPLVLAASAQGERLRPYGIISGFVIAFTAFALVSRQLVLWLGIDASILRTASLWLLAFFALTLLSTQLSERFGLLTQRLAAFGSVRSTRVGTGFAGGMLIGALIGLVWTPCAGPILAAALVQIIRQESSFGAMLLIGSFALGAGVPMLIIALMGQRLLPYVRRVASHATALRRVSGIIVLLTVFFLGSGLDTQALLTGQLTSASAVAQPSGLQEGLAEPYIAPELSGIEQWLNANPLTLAKLKGKVVLIDFWTYSCINCVRTLPYLTRWDRSYRDDGLVIIGVHAPEFEFEKDAANVKAAIAAHHIEYPVALDNRFDTWTAYRNRYWPAHYLIDRDGRVVYTHFGEGNYGQTEHNIRHLLGLGALGQGEADPVTYSRKQSPETYLGYERSERFVSPQKLKPNMVQHYSLPASIPADSWALNGKWTIGPQRITSAQAGAALKYNFTAAKVFLVLGSRDGVPLRARILLNDKPASLVIGDDGKKDFLEVGKHDLYTLINQDEMKEGMVEIVAESPGLEAYAFTFGS